MSLSLFNYNILCHFWNERLRKLAAMLLTPEATGPALDDYATRRTVRFVDDDFADDDNLSEDTWSVENGASVRGDSDGSVE